MRWYTHLPIASAAWGGPGAYELGQHPGVEMYPKARTESGKADWGEDWVRLKRVMGSPGIRMEAHMS